MRGLAAGLDRVPVSGEEVDAGEALEVRARGGLRLSVRGLRQRDDERGAHRGDGLYGASYPPSAGAINLVVTATTSGSTDTQSVSAVANQSYEIAPDGPPVTVTTQSPGENAWVYDARAGRRIALRMSGVTIGTSPCCSTKVSITKPDG